MRTGKLSGLDLSNIFGYSNISGSLPGSLFVLPYYGSGDGIDTVITIAGGGSELMHLFFIDTLGTLVTDVYVTGSGTVTASVVDPGNTGVVLGVASNTDGKAISKNLFSVSARVTMPDYIGTESAFLFKFLNPETPGGITNLVFDGLTFLEPFPGSVGLVNIYSDSFVAFASLNGILASGLGPLSVGVRLLGPQTSTNLYSRPTPTVCQVSGVLTSIFPDSTIVWNVLPSSFSVGGVLWANCSFAMVLNKTEKLYPGLVVDGGNRVSGSVTIPVITP
jgi:hypothetical protein